MKLGIQVEHQHQLCYHCGIHEQVLWELRLHCRVYVTWPDLHGYPGRALTPTCIALNNCRVTWPDLFRVMTIVEMVLYMGIRT